MRAYHGKKEVKEGALATALWHEATDRYEKGVYWLPGEGRGCAVGCWSKDPRGGHKSLEKDLGIPEVLLRMADGLFEALPAPDFQNWPYRFAASVPVGADLSGAWAEMLTWCLFDPRFGLAALAKRWRTQSVLSDLEVYMDWQAEGLGVPKDITLKLEEQLGQMADQLRKWQSWEDFANADVRAQKALEAVWEARSGEPQLVEKAAWACRAAWYAQADYVRAQAQAMLDAMAASAGHEDIYKDLGL